MTLGDLGLEATFNINLDPLKKGLAQAGQSLTSFATAQTYAGTQTTAFGMAANAAGGSLGIFKERMAEAKISMQQLGASVASVGKLMTASLTVPLTALAAGAFASANDVNKALAGIEAQTGATGARAAMLSESFKKVGGEVPNSLARVGQALGGLAQRTGLTGAALETLTKQELTLARVTGTDINDVVRDSSRLFAQWGVTVAAQPAALDQLLRASQATGIKLKELEETLTRSGPQLKALGFGFSESAALLASFESHGENTQRVMMALNQGLAAMARSGITDAHQALGVLVEKIKAAPTSVAAMTEVVRIFGARGAASMVKAVQDGAFSIDKLTKTIKDGQQTIEKAGQQTETFAQTWQRLKNNVELALAPLGATLQQVLQKLADLLVPVLQKLQGVAAAFNMLPFPIKGAAVAFGVVLAAMGPVLVAGGLMIAQAPGIVAGWAVLSTFATETLVPALVGIGVTMEALFPPLLIATGIFLGLKYAWDRDLGHARTAVSEFWAGTGVLFNQGIEYIGGLMTKGWPVFVQTFQDTWTKMTTAFAADWAVFSQSFAMGIGQIKGLLIGGWDTVTAPFRTAFSTLPPFVTSMFVAVGNVVRTAFKTIAQYIHDLAPGLFDTLAKVGGFFAHWFNKAGFDAGLKELQAGWDNVRKVGRDAMAAAAAEQAAAAKKSRDAAMAAAKADADAAAKNTAAEMAKLMAGGKEKHVKETPQERKEAELTDALAGAQAKLNELVIGEGNIAGQVAAKYHILTSAHAEAQKAALVLAEERIRGTEKAIAGEDRYRKELDATNQKIRQVEAGLKPQAVVTTDFGPRVNQAQRQTLEQAKQRLASDTQAAAAQLSLDKQLDAALNKEATRHEELAGSTAKDASAADLFNAAVRDGRQAVLDKAQALLAATAANDGLLAAQKALTAQSKQDKEVTDALNAVELRHQEVQDQLSGAGKQLTDVQKALNKAYADGNPALIARALADAALAAADDKALASAKGAATITERLNSIQTQAREIIDSHGQKVTLAARAQELLNQAMINGSPAAIKLAQDTLTLAKAADQLTAGQTAWQKALTKTRDFMTNEFTKGFENIFKTGFKGVFSTILADLDSLLQQMAAKILAAKLTDLLLGGSGAANAAAGAQSGGGGAGGLVGLLGGLVGGLFGGGSATAGMDFSGAGDVAAGATAVPFGPGLAGGGDIFGGQSRWVGENGPELWTPSQSGHVTPNSQAGAAAAGAGGHTFVFNVSSPDPASFKKSQGQMMSDAHRQAEMWRIRNGS
jgi:phage-related minor tail protein